jgi:hypothetical protein
MSGDAMPAAECCNRLFHFVTPVPRCNVARIVAVVPEKSINLTGSMGYREFFRVARRLIWELARKGFRNSFTYPQQAQETK